MRTLGFDATNDIFAENAWYFRNALVRANYNDLKNGIHESTEYLELFLRNLLLNEKNELHNRSTHISGKLADFEKADIDVQKADIDVQKADIDAPKADIDIKLKNIDKAVISKTRNHILKLYNECGSDDFWGRSTLENITGLKSTRASELIKIMLESDIIEPVQGNGKGKYRFK